MIAGQCPETLEIQLVNRRSPAPPTRRALRGGGPAGSLGFNDEGGPSGSLGFNVGLAFCLGVDDDAGASGGGALGCEIDEGRKGVVGADKGGRRGAGAATPAAFGTKTGSAPEGS